MTYSALLHRFNVSCSHPDLSAFLTELLAPLEVTSGSASRTSGYELRVSAREGATSELVRDGRVLVRTTEPQRVFTRFMRDLNVRASEVTGATHTVLHAAALHRVGRTVILPGAPGAGKSTLAARLLLNGWGYLSDELVALAPDAVGLALPYPRSITLDPGSWALFDGHTMDIPPAVLPLLPNVRFVPAAQVASRPERLPPATDIVVYRWRPDDAGELVELDAVECLRALLGSSFTLQRAPQRDLDLLAELTARSNCWTLRSRHLDDAQELLERRLGATSRGTEPSRGDVT